MAFARTCASNKKITKSQDHKITKKRKPVEDQLIAGDRAHEAKAAVKRHAVNGYDGLPLCNFGVLLPPVWGLGFRV